MIVAIVWLALGLVVGMLGKKTRLGFWGSFIFSIFFTPIVPLLITLFTTDNTKS